MRCNVFMRFLLNLILLMVFSGCVIADTVYVTIEKDNTLAVVDGQTGELKKTVSIGRRPRGIALSADQTTVVRGCE